MWIKNSLTCSSRRITASSGGCSKTEILFFPFPLLLDVDDDDDDAVGVVANSDDDVDGFSLLIGVV